MIKVGDEKKFPPPLFCLKSSLGLGGVKIFLPNVDHLLGLSYPENLSSIGLMVEAVDTLCGTGTGTGTGRARGWDGHGW